MTAYDPELAHVRIFNSYDEAHNANVGGGLAGLFYRFGEQVVFATNEAIAEAHRRREEIPVIPGLDPDPQEVVTEMLVNLYQEDWRPPDSSTQFDTSY